jgi:hypothetical protein
MAETHVSLKQRSYSEVQEEHYFKQPRAFKSIVTKVLINNVT